MFNYNEEYIIRIDRSSIRYLCWVFVLINMYLEIPVTLPIIKSILGLPTILSLPILFYACKLKLRQSDINFVASIIAITLLSILSAAQISTLPSYLLKVLQFFFATVAGILMFKITRSIPYKKKYKTLLSIS